MRVISLTVTSGPDDRGATIEISDRLESGWAGSFSDLPSHRYNRTEQPC